MNGLVTLIECSYYTSNINNYFRRVYTNRWTKVLSKIPKIALINNLKGLIKFSIPRYGINTVHCAILAQFHK